MHLALVNLYDMQRRLYPVQLAFKFQSGCMLFSAQPKSLSLSKQSADRCTVSSHITAYHGNVPPASDIALQTTWVCTLPSQNVLCCRTQTLTVSRAAQTLILVVMRLPETLPLQLTALTAPVVLS